MLVSKVCIVFATLPEINRFIIIVFNFLFSLLCWQLNYWTGLSQVKGHCYRKRWICSYCDLKIKSRPKIVCNIYVFCDVGLIFRTMYSFVIRVVLMGTSLLLDIIFSATSGNYILLCAINWSVLVLQSSCMRRTLARKIRIKKN